MGALRENAFRNPLPFSDEIHDDEEGNGEGMPLSLSPFFLFPSPSACQTSL